MPPMGNIPLSKHAPALLIVDDEDGVIHAIRETLQVLQYRMIGTTDPFRALDLIQLDRSIVLLVTDLYMPAMDGEDLLEKGRKIRPGLPAVLTTGIASDEQLKFWKKRGELVIGKPWIDQEFVEAVRKALGKGPRHS
jgi:CheY-like chemotaxis protein